MECGLIDGLQRSALNFQAVSCEKILVDVQNQSGLDARALHRVGLQRRGRAAARPYLELSSQLPYPEGGMCQLLFPLAYLRGASCSSWTLTTASMGPTLRTFPAAGCPRRSMEWP